MEFLFNGLEITEIPRFIHPTPVETKEWLRQTQGVYTTEYLAWKLPPPCEDRSAFQQQEYLYYDLAAGQVLRESRRNVERVVALLTLLLGSVMLISPAYAIFTGEYPSIFFLQDLGVWILGLSLG